MFVRRCGVAWGISSGSGDKILKTELLDSAYLIMLPYIIFNKDLIKMVNI